MPGVYRGFHYDSLAHQLEAGIILTKPNFLPRIVFSEPFSESLTLFFGQCQPKFSSPPKYVISLGDELVFDEIINFFLRQNWTEHLTKTFVLLDDYFNARPITAC